MSSVRRPTVVHTRSQQLEQLRQERKKKTKIRIKTMISRRMPILNISIATTRKMMKRMTTLNRMKT